jgi:hypothetical protein
MHLHLFTFRLYTDFGILSLSEVRHQWLVLLPLELFCYFVCLVIPMGSQDSVVGVMTRIETGQLRNHGSIPGNERDFCFPKHPDGF